MSMLPIARVVRSVQYGTITAAGSSNTATITSVNTAKSVVNFLGMTNGVTDTPGGTSIAIGAFYGRLTLTNATTVTCARGNGTDATCIMSFVVVEYW